MSEYVYVISAAQNMQKIGIANDPQARHAYRAEQYVHEAFSGFRIRGEWFEVGVIAAVELVCYAITFQEKPEIYGNKLWRIASAKNELEVEWLQPEEPKLKDVAEDFAESEDDGLL